MLTLSPAVSVVAADSAVIFLSERRALRVECGPLSAPLVQRATDSPRLAHWLKDIPPGLAARMVRELRDCGFLIVDTAASPVPPVFARNAGWLALHNADPEAARIRLATARVAILGVGGIGGEVLRHLAGAGVGHFFLIDGDRVEPSNLNRQYLFEPTDFGKVKAMAAAKAIRRCYPDADIDCAERFVATVRDLDPLDDWRPDLLICAADSPVGEIEGIVADYARATGIAWIGGALGLERGYWGPVFPAHGCPCHPCASDIPAETEGADAWAATLPQVRSVHSFGPSNGIIAGLIARDALVWLLGAGQVETAPPVGRRVIDLMTMTITAPSPLRCRRACAA
jgi:sulfur-carrier protein adenylyltransferase/sulfurtransferase